MSRAVLILTMLAAVPASAQSPAIDLQLYRPTPDPNGVLGTPTAEMSGHLNYHFGVTANWSHQPLRLTIADEGVPLGDVIGDRVDLHLLASLNLFNWVELGVDFPAILYQRGINTEIVERVLGVTDIPSSGIGDVGIYLKTQILAPDGFIPALAVGADVMVPSGDPAGFTGQPGAAITPFVIVSQRIYDDIWTLQLGYRARLEKQRIADIEIGDELVYRLGVAYRLGRLPSESRAKVLVEVAGQTPADHPFGLGDGARNVRARTSLEVRVGMRFPWLTGAGGIRLTPAVGIGALPAVGSPLVRGLLSVDFLDREPRGDDDRDRVPNRVDQCPQEREDRDDFEDEDGCPEPDNDGDNIPDEDDECPEDPEDVDGDQDRDGCPDIMAPDKDGDGIPDSEDGCPDVDEDNDGFEDWDGCPEEDNDKDGLPDIGDVCPNAAEDKNGFEDDDGCPDGGKRAKLVTVKRERLELHQPLRFGENKAELHERSVPLLDAIAAVLKEDNSLRLRVVVRPGKPNRQSRRLAIDRAGTIVTELVSRGIDEKRLRTPDVRYRRGAKRTELLLERRRR